MRRLVALAAACILAGSAAATEMPRRGGRLILALNADIRSLEPGNNRDSNGDSVLHQIFEGLVAYRADLSVGPSLASSWNVSDDGKVYRFTLRDGVKFHNGAPLTAKEVKWSWEHLRSNPAWDCRNAWDGTQGTNVLSLETPDQATVVFTLAAPSATFLTMLANIQCNVLVAHPDSVDAKGGWTPIGTGPLTLKEWKRGQYVRLARFADYKVGDAPPSGYSGARQVYVDEVEFQVIPDESAAFAAIETGAVDVIFQPAPDRIDELKQRGLKIEMGPGLVWDVLLINSKDPLLSNAKLRLAIAHAIDIRQLAAAGSNGEAVPDPASVPPSSVYFDQGFVEWPAYDPTLAAKLAKEAGYAGQPISIETNKRFTPIYNNSVLAQAMLSAAGFNARLEMRDWATQLTNYMQRDFQIQSFAFSPRTDPALSYATFIGDMAKYGWAQWDDPRAVRLLTESLTTTDTVARKRLFQEIQAMLRQEIPIIGLYYETVSQAVGPHVHGWAVWPVGKPITWGAWKDG